MYNSVPGGVGEAVMGLVEGSHVCPNCGGTSVYRSIRRSALEFLLHCVFFRSPYRCQDCDERFFSFRHFKHSPKPFSPGPTHRSA